MPYLTLTETLKLQLSPDLVASYDIHPALCNTGQESVSSKNPQNHR